MDLDKDELEVTKNKNRIKRIESYLKQIEEIEILDIQGMAKTLSLLCYCVYEIKEYIESKEK